MIDLELLQVVRVIAESGSFREAAQKLDVSPPAVTRAVKRAEQYLGSPLFRRNRHGISLTPGGRAFLLECRELLAHANSFEASIGRIQKSGGRIVIGCGPLPTGNIVSPLIGSLSNRWKELEITVHVKADIDPVLALRSGEVDLFIGDLTHTTGFDDLDFMLLRCHEMQIVAAPGHPAFDDSPLSLAHLVEYKVALPFLHKYWRTTFESDIRLNRVCISASGTRFQQVTCDDFSLLIELAKSHGFVIGGCPEHFADSIATGRLRELQLTRPIFWNLCAARLERASSPALDACWDWLGVNWQKDGRKARPDR